MRIHASKKKDGYEQYYADMQLFLPWIDENKDLHLNDENGCIRKFESLKQIILAMKKKMLPFANIAEDMNNLVNENDGKTRPNHLYDSLDAEYEK